MVGCYILKINRGGGGEGKGCLFPHIRKKINRNSAIRTEGIFRIRSRHIIIPKMLTLSIRYHRTFLKFDS